MQKGKLLIVSGPSGAGKTTLLRELVAKAPQPLTMSVSATTRPARPGEMDGTDYHFLTDQQFQQRRRAGEFVECFEVFGRGYWYGTLWSEVTASLDQGQWVVLEIDVQGMNRVVEQFPEALTFFVRPRSLEELERRLRGRKTEDEQTIQRRLEVARHEWQFAKQYQFEIINDCVDQAVDEICEILRTLGE